MQLFRNPGSFLIFALSASLKHYWSWVPYTSVFQLKSQSVSCSVMSDCLQPLEPTSLLCPWGSPDKNTGVGCDFLLWGIFLTQGSNPGILHCRQILYHLSCQGSPYVFLLHAESLQSCPALCDLMDCSPPGSSVHGIFQARILKWVAMPSSRGSSQPRDQTQVSCIVDVFFTIWVTREAQEYWSG